MTKLEKAQSEYIEFKEKYSDSLEGYLSAHEIEPFDVIIEKDKQLRQAIENARKEQEETKPIPSYFAPWECPRCHKIHSPVSLTCDCPIQTTINSSTVMINQSKI